DSRSAIVEATSRSRWRVIRMSKRGDEESVQTVILRKVVKLPINSGARIHHRTVEIIDTSSVCDPVNLDTIEDRRAAVGSLCIICVIDIDLKVCFGAGQNLKLPHKECSCARC